MTLGISGSSLCFALHLAHSMTLFNVQLFLFRLALQLQHLGIPSIHFGQSNDLFGNPHIACVILLLQWDNTGARHLFTAATIYIVIAVCQVCWFRCVRYVDSIMSAFWWARWLDCDCALLSMLAALWPHFATHVGCNATALFSTLWLDARCTMTRPFVALCMNGLSTLPHHLGCINLASWLIILIDFL